MRCTRAHAPQSCRLRKYRPHAHGQIHGQVELQEMWALAILTGDRAVGGARRWLEHAQEIVAIDLVREVHEQCGDWQQHRDRGAEGEGDADHLED